MNRDLVKPLLWAMLAVNVAAAPKPPASGKMADLIQRLGDESFVVRERATRDLWKLGEAALPLLQRVAAGDDPEAAVRALDLERKIELGILPDSSPRIVELVLRYDRGNVDERRLVISEMTRQRAWRQILKLYALEKDEATLAMLDLAVRGVAIDAARESLTKNPPDIQEAFSYLEMARPEPSEYMAMASLHRSNGTLAAELKKALADGAESPALWRYALLAAAGRLEEAAAAATEAGLELAAARLHLLTGDPLPWLSAAAPLPQAIPAGGLAAYRELAIDSWLGKAPKAGQMRELRRFVHADEAEEAGKDLRLLFLAGDHAEAEKLLADLDPRAAFYYFESSERIDEALEAFGLDPKNPDYAGWAMKRFRVLIDDPDQEEFEMTELSLLGHYLEHRGQFKELDAAFTPPLAELARADGENFLRAATRLFSGAQLGVTTTVRPVIKAVAGYAGDDEVRWLQAVGNLFEGQEDSGQLWHWLATLEPSLGNPERLELMCRIYGFLPDPGGDRAKFFEQAWAAVEPADPVDRRQKLELLADLAHLLKDPENFLRGAEAIDNAIAAGSMEADTERFKGSYLVAAGRWEEAAIEWLKVTERFPADPVYHASAAASLRRAGNHEAADDQEHLAELLALGETRSQYQCAQEFALTGDFDRAEVWWNRAGAECTRETSSFLVSAARLSEVAMTKGDWKTAAALSEMLAFQQALSGSEAFQVPVTFGLAMAVRPRIEANLAHALDRLETDRAAALQEIERAAAMPYADLSLADHFFAPMRAVGLVEIHDRAFERHWKNLTRQIERFPGSHNTRNSAAWLASRANRRLAEAEAYLEKALITYPCQAAYLDTMAEVHFAAGDRARAVEFSERGLEELPNDLQLIRQHQRFVSGPLPPK